ncbi:hypothetical protein GBF35_15275 [Nonomuraea phyllanthi]|nr:hypothetical protein GBF35_15275 [Nonomuraea phyllanthi]
MSSLVSVASPFLLREVLDTAIPQRRLGLLSLLIGGMQATVTSTATSLVSNLTTVVATVIAMLALDWRLTIVSLLLLPLFVAVSRRVGAERETITARRQSHLATMSADVQESLSISGILLGRTTAVFRRCPSRRRAPYHRHVRQADAACMTAHRFPAGRRRQRRTACLRRRAAS